MIRYHGTPLTPNSAAAVALARRHAMVSYFRPDQIELVAEVCESFVLDNGAYSAWQSGRAVADWSGYYKFCEDWLMHPGCDWAIVPDVIDGSEHDNDSLLLNWPHGRHRGVPVWHLHESLRRVVRLADEWPRVALGSSGEYASPGSESWWSRRAEALRLICDDRGRPRTKLHGLRMLDPRLVELIPFASVDSTTLAFNVGIDQRWSGRYAPVDKGSRGLILAQRLEAGPSAATWDARNVPPTAFGCRLEPQQPALFELE